VRPRLLDLFCCEGGASRGYAEAGFEVVGVDVDPQPNYPYEFHLADAMTFPLAGFDAVTASPPCTGHSTMAAVNGFRGEHGTEWMLHATIDRLASSGKPYVVENVSGARLPGSLTLCGSEFGLTDGEYLLKRHRKFVSNILLMGAGGCACRGRRIIGVYGDLSKNDRKATSRVRADGRPHGDMRAGVERARRIMRMPWASPHGLTQAIPPAYTRFLGEQLMAHLRMEAAA
jgi:DNA (cytosine-5)-methyltransferase 1